MVNLIVMIFAWLSATFCFYMISFELKYLPGNIFVNTYASAFGDLASTIVSGIVVRYLGIKYTLIASYSMATLGAFLICIWGWNTQEQNKWIMPSLVLFAKFGISAAFNIVYIGNSALFPTLFTATSLGICNVLARTATIFAPFVAEIDGVTPMWIVVGITGITTIACLFLRKPDAM
jgi:hypothetical protein